MTSERVVVADVVGTPLDVADIARLVTTDADGAVVTFSGVIRDHDGGRTVAALEYEAHPAAAAVLTGVAEAIADAHPTVRVAVFHRIGHLEIGEVALVAAVASAHRAEAFAACGALIDRVKAETPIWKLQRFRDGSDEWVAAL